VYQNAASCWSGDGGRPDTWSERVAAELRTKAPGDRLLDVGCNVGNLVAAAIEQGFDAEGVDLDPSAIAHGRSLGRSVSTTPVDELEGPYDVIVMNHVLEHVSGLRELLGQVDRLLAPGGLLAIQVPCYKGAIPRLMRERWFAWAPDEHVWHFTTETLPQVVQKSTSLHPVDVQARGKIEPPSTGAKGLAKKVIAASADRLGWGDQVVATFRAPAEPAA
jgi:SAM-dependent methyltransferase